MTWTRRVGIAAVVAVAVGTLVWGGAAGSAVVTTTLAPVADAYVDAGRTSSNFGTATTLADDASPVRQSFLRFDLSGVAGPVQSAVLRIHVADVDNAGSPDAGAVARVTETAWTETGVTYANRPTGWGPNVASLGRATRNAWMTVDVTAAVTAGARITLGIRSTDDNGADFNSRQGPAATAPQLVVTAGAPDVTTTTAGAPTTTTAAPTTTTTIPPGGGPITLLPVADTYVDASAPTSAFGSATRMFVDASPVEQMFLRFDLSSVATPILQARLRLHVADVSDARSPASGFVAPVTDDGWSEGAVTYATRPTGWGADVATIGAVSRNTWIEIPVTGAVAAGGVVTLGLRSTNSDGATYDSREVAANSPRLLVSTGTPPTGLDAVGAACASALISLNGPTIADPQLDETSGIDAGMANPGLSWLHNDSGDTARVFAVDRATGTTSRIYTLGTAVAEDIEDIAVGPGPVPGTPYLHVADIGDNSARRSQIAIYRVPEPAVTPGPATTLPGVDTLILNYPDGAHNAESLVVDPVSGELFIIAKTSGGGSTGVYRAPASLPAGSRTVMTRVGTLSLPTGSDNVVTAADLSADGTQLAVRTYDQVLLWHRTPTTPVGTVLGTSPCLGPVPAEVQGEAIAFDPDGRGYVTLSEGFQPVLHRAVAP